MWGSHLLSCRQPSARASLQVSAKPGRQVCLKKPLGCNHPLVFHLAPEEIQSPTGHGRDKGCRRRLGQPCVFLAQPPLGCLHLWQEQTLIEESLDLSCLQPSFLSPLRQKVGTSPSCERMLDYVRRQGASGLEYLRARSQIGCDQDRPAVSHQSIPGS